MGFSNSRFIELKDIYTNGFVDNVASFQMDDKYSPFVRNVRINGRGVTKRPGQELIKDLAVSGETAKGIGSYERADPANNRILIRYNVDATHKLTTLKTDGTQVDIVTTGLITVDDRMEFLNIGDVIYAYNGTDLIGKLDGTTYTQITEAVTGGNLAPAFAVFFDGKVFASGWDVNPNTVYQSVGDDPEDFTGTGKDTFTFENQITGLATNSQSLFYFTNKTVDTTDIDDIIGTTVLSFVHRPVIGKQQGSVNHASIVSALDRVYYVTPSNKINYLARGTGKAYQVVEFTDRRYAGISTTMKNLDPDQTESFGYYIPEQHIIKWHFKSLGSTFNDVCVAYDIENDAFLQDTRKFFFAGAIFEGNAFTVSMLTGKVYQDEKGLNDDGLAVSMEYRTKEFDLGEISRNKQFWEYRNFVEINELASISVETFIDGGLVDTATIDASCTTFASTGGMGTVPVAEFEVGAPGIVPSSTVQGFAFVRPKAYLQNKGKTIQFRYKESTLGAIATVQDLQLRAELLPYIDNNRTC